MILFTDTSALVKLYVEEAGSAEMASRAAGARMALSVLAYAEVHATFARRRREELFTPEELAATVERFEREWQAVLRVAVSTEVLAFVPGLCQRHPLRGADAVHLASALQLGKEGLETAFATSDARLAKAARAEGLEVFDPAPPGDARAAGSAVPEDDANGNEK